MIAAVAFVIGLIGSLFATGASFAERLMIGAMMAAMAFVAALILFLRDRAQHLTIMRRVRKVHLAREDVNESDFLAQFPDHDSELLAHTRQAVSQFFDVPPEKLHPTDNLREDLKFDRLQPGFHSFVMFHVFAAREVVLPQTLLSFDTRNLSDFGDLADEIQRVLDRIGTAKTENDDNSTN